MLWSVMGTDFGAMPPSCSWASLGCEGRKGRTVLQTELRPTTDLVYLDVLANTQFPR